MKDDQTIRYTEWRPIGVCDEGEGKARKAVIFSAKEIQAVTASNVNRHNWKENPEILKIIHRNAKKVAKLSPLTKGMIRPKVVDIQLVGVVLQFNRTPNLNSESEEGRVQLFQVRYLEHGKKKRWGRWLLLMIGLLIGFIGLLILFEQDFNRAQQQLVATCGTKRSSRTYTMHLNRTINDLEAIIYQMPLAVQPVCEFSQRSIQSSETDLLNCYLSFQSLDSSVKPQSPQVQKIEQCVQNICEKSLPHVTPLCKRLF